MPNFGYKEMLGIGKPFNPSDTHLNNLAEFMVKAPNADSKIPAGYTYLAQFIDHDISRDSKGNEDNPPWRQIELNTIYNMRNPVFDLETIYGHENPSNNGEIARRDLLETKSRLKLGYTIREGHSPYKNAKRAYQRDLLRKADSLDASIVDSRNDENFLIAQTQTAFTKFHNTIVSTLKGRDTTALFNTAREIAIRHYQYIVLYDFLPKIIKESVLTDVLEHGNKFYDPKPDDMFIPLEFSAAAFRMGHAMIRNSYNLNSVFTKSDTASLNQLIQLTGRGKMGGRSGLSSLWLIDWSLFYDIDNSRIIKANDFNLAKKISTKISVSLGFLQGVMTFARHTSLPAFDLYRGRALGLPTGQAVAKVVKSKVGNTEILTAAEIQNLLPEKLPEELLEVFKNETPLWFYLLAEAERQTDGETLGDVGSRIVAETFVKLLRESPFSILNNDLRSDENFLAEDKKTFGMPEMLKFIASQNFDELNPMG